MPQKGVPLVERIDFWDQTVLGKILNDFKADFMDELEDLHMDRTNIGFTTTEVEGEGWDSVKLY